MKSSRCLLVSRFFQHAEAHPEAVAFFDPDGKPLCTRKELTRAVLLAVDRLQKMQLPPRPVVLSLPNGPGLVSELLALRMLGHVVVLADATAPKAELKRVAMTLGACGILASLERLAGGMVLDKAGLGLEPLTPSAVPLPRRAAICKLSSGSTGQPQAFAASAGQLAADARQIFKTMGIGRQDRTLAAIPLTHSYGLGSCLMPLLLWGTPLVLPACNLPAALAHTLAAAKVRHFPAVPAMVRALAALPTLPSWPELRVCLAAGAPLAPKDAAAFAAATGYKVHVFYGSSECGGIAYDRSQEAVLEAGAVGTPLEGVQVEVVDEKGKPCPPGEKGRIRVRSKAVVLAAVPPLPDPSVLTPGRFLTGDLGFFDERGILHLAGRSSDLVNVAGKKVHPEEVRRVLEQVPGVMSAVVVGIPDRHRGQVLGAVLAVDGAAAVTVHKVLSFCRTHLAPYKVPRRILLVPELPTDARGKIPRQELLALLTGKEGQTRQV